MIDLRKIVIIFVIAALYAIFVNALIGAVYPETRYEDFCKEKIYRELKWPVAERVECPKYKEPTSQELDKCSEEKGFPDYARDANGCTIEFKGCNYCQKDFDKANEKHSFIFFIISSVLAVVAIVIGLILPEHKSLNQWIATGFMLGGLVTLFFGTFTYYQYLGRYVKPIVILIELMIVVYISYKKLQDIKEVRKRKKM